MLANLHHFTYNTRNCRFLLSLSPSPSLKTSKIEISVKSKTTCNKNIISPFCPLAPLRFFVFHYFYILIEIIKCLFACALFLL